MDLAKTAVNKSQPAQLTVWRARLLLVLWAAIAFVFLAVFAADLWVSYRLMATPCAGSDCHYQAVTAGEAEVLAGWGLSIPVYALYMLGISILPVALFSVLAVVILLQLYPQRGGFLFAIMLLVIPVVAITSFNVVAAAWPRWATHIQMLVVLGHFLLMSFFLVFPRARFEPQASVILPFISAFIGVTTAFGFIELPALRALPIYTLLLVLVAGVIIHRYRRLFNETERLQTKWVILGLLVFFAGVPIWTYIFEISTPATERESLLLVLGGWTLLMLITLFLPATIFIAIFRHNLWDIDLILNRTLVYGILTAGIIAFYTLIVGGVGALLHNRSNFLLSLVATGVIALLFQPVRERLQRTINRMIYGDRDDPYTVLSRLSKSLQETAARDQILSKITSNITQTLKLPFAAIEVETTEGNFRPVATEGRRPATVNEWPLCYQGQVIGRLVVGTRSPSDSFTAQERQLLTDIASQAGAAAYTVQLITALQKSRERLVLTREEERRRIRRDLHDELGPSLASQTFQFDSVLELLDTDPQAAVDLLTTLKAQNQALVGDVRRIVYELRPPTLDELGLVAALNAHFGQIASPTITLTAAPDPLSGLPAAIEVAAYRIILEAVNNVIRHAQANHCIVSLAKADDQLALTIEDDGVGIPSGNPAGIGLLSMRERAEEVGGTFRFDTSAGCVRVRATLPLGTI